MQSIILTDTKKQKSGISVRCRDNKKTFRLRVRIGTPLYSTLQIYSFCVLMNRYPDYTFYGDTAVAQSAQLNSRYGTESLKGVLLDIHFLSLCDYLVCTFSSQV